MKRKWRLAPLKMVTQRYTTASRKLTPRAHPETTPMIHTWNPRSWTEHVTNVIHLAVLTGCQNSPSMALELAV